MNNLTPFARLNSPGVEKQAMTAFRAVGKLIPRITGKANRAAANAGHATNPVKWRNIEVTRPGDPMSGNSLGRIMGGLKDDALEAVGTAKGSPERNWLASAIRDLRSSQFAHPQSKALVGRSGGASLPAPAAVTPPAPKLQPTARQLFPDF